MITVMHLSDLHFGTESPQVVACLIRQIREVSPEVVVISGDLTQRAKWREFHAAKRFVDAIKSSQSKVVVVPGNHDIPLYNPVARMLRPFHRYRSVFGSTRVAVEQLGRLRFITVNSVRRERHAEGFITVRHRHEVVRRAQEAAEGDINIVVTHHPLGIDSLSLGDDTHDGDVKTCDAWHDAGVNIILSGHIHRPFLINAREQLVNYRNSAESPMWILNAGTAISKRVRHDHPNSYNLLKFNADQLSSRMMVERWDFGVQPGHFTCRNSLEVELQASQASHGHQFRAVR